MPRFALVRGPTVTEQKTTTFCAQLLPHHFGVSPREWMK